MLPTLLSVLVQFTKTMFIQAMILTAFHSSTLYIYRIHQKLALNAIVISPANHSDDVICIYQVMTHGEKGISKFFCTPNVFDHMRTA